LVPQIAELERVAAAMTDHVPGPSHHAGGEPPYPYAAGPVPGEPYGVPAWGPHPAGTAGGAVQPYSPTPAAAVQPYGQPGPPAWGGPAASPYQAVPWQLVSPGGRLGAHLLDFVLWLVTLGIGYLIWTLIVWGKGQTPGKQLLGHVVADANTGVPFGWGQMFVRNFLIQGLLFGLVNIVTVGIFGLVDAFTVFGTNYRTLHDQMAGSIVRHG
jgi:uncharacterized RDD family membrane protein YckC